MNTSALEVKLNAVVVMRNIIRNMGPLFYDYIDEVANVCLDKLLLDPSSRMRIESSKCMRACIEAAKDNPSHQK